MPVTASGCALPCYAQGYCEAVATLVCLGLLDDSRRQTALTKGNAKVTRRRFVRDQLGLAADATFGDVAEAAARRLRAQHKVWQERLDAFNVQRIHRMLAWLFADDGDRCMPQTTTGALLPLSPPPPGVLLRRRNAHVHASLRNRHLPGIAVRPAAGEAGHGVRPSGARHGGHGARACGAQRRQDDASQIDAARLWR